jgi:lysophospholipase L1-like esterase
LTVVILLDDLTRGERRDGHSTHRLVVIALVASVICLAPGVVSAATKQPPGQLTCGPFAQTAVQKPAQQTDPEAVQRFELINSEAKARSHTVVFLGDSLTQKWDRSVWEQSFMPIDALNAGVNGDRTDNLLWRIGHGNLDGQRPDLVVLLIGTNDIGRNRPPRVIAEGVREILLALRSRLQKAQILLLGILPRSESPDSERRRQVAEVNQLIRTCADHEHVFYGDVGDALLDRAGRLTREVSPDGVHLSQHGYAILTDRLELEFGRLPPAK